MRVRLLTTMAGPAGTVQPGQIAEVSTATGRELIAGGYAVAVDVERAPGLETATIEAPEAAVLRQGRPRGRRADG